MNGMHPGPSSEEIFRPRDEEGSVISNPHSNSDGTLETQRQGSDRQETNSCLQTGEICIALYKESEKESWDEAKIELRPSSSSSNLSLDDDASKVISVPGNTEESHQPAIIVPSSSTSSFNEN